MSEDGEPPSLTTQCLTLCRQLATTGFSLFFNLNLETKQEKTIEEEKKSKVKKKIPLANMEKNVMNKEAFLRQKKRDALKYVELPSENKIVSIKKETSGE